MIDTVHNNNDNININNNNEHAPRSVGVDQSGDTSAQSIAHNATPTTITTTTYKQTINRADSDKWFNAMKQELKSLLKHKNGTQVLLITMCYPIDEYIALNMMQVVRYSKTQHG